VSIASGQQLLHYRILEKLGEGGMGVVWKALDTKLDRDVAIKVLPDSTASDPQRMARFRREAKTLAALNHPNIVTLYALEHDDSRYFLVMEYVNGQTLDRVIPENGLPFDRFLELTLPLVEAVAVAHRHNITHRDLKPGNVIVGGDGRSTLRRRQLGAADQQHPSGSTTRTDRSSCRSAICARRNRRAVS
jgi:serine/threonine protein kinase